MTYPFGSITGNLAAFCGVLRRVYRFRIGPGELLDASRALQIVDLADPHVVRHALRPILSGTADEAAVFDRAFAKFFLGTADDGGKEDARAARLEPGASATGAGQHVDLDHEPSTNDSESVEDAGAASSPATPLETIALESDVTGPLRRSSYSPLAATSADVPTLVPVDAAWTAGARALVNRARFGVSRRWRSAAAGSRFDLRRTLRASLQTGGEPLAPRWRRRRTGAPRFVILIDGSRSMSSDTQTALRFAVAIASATTRIEVFTFSTSIRRITADARRAAAGEPRVVEGLDMAWGGGTTIGSCVRDFLQRHGDRVLSASTVTIVVSDGLDVGDPEELRDAVAELRRRSAALVWLNPLLATDGYEPSARGMTAARPYITTFFTVSLADDVFRLARAIRASRR